MFLYQDIQVFCVFDKSENFKITYLVIAHCCTLELTLLAVSLEPQSIKMKFGQILVHLMETWETFPVCIFIYCEDWKLVPGSLYGKLFS